MTAMMRAHVQREYAPVSTGSLEVVSVPQPGPGDVLVQVVAAALNPADVFIATGTPGLVRTSYGLTRPKQPVRGQDVAGTVVSIGADVTGFSPGDSVYGGARGSLAEFALADASRLAIAPRSLTSEQAAAVPMAGVTALSAMEAGEIGPGTRLLVNGASGGVGHFVVQLAANAGAQVTAVCSTRNVEMMKDLGASRVIDYTKTSVLDTPGEYDVILDNVGNHRLRELRRLLTARGTLLPNTGNPGPDGGAIARVVKAGVSNLFTKQTIKVFGTDYKTDALEHLAAEFDAGRLRVVVDNLFPLDRAVEAFERVAGGHARGKVVVTLG